MRILMRSLRLCIVLAAVGGLMVFVGCSKKKPVEPKSKPKVVQDMNIQKATDEDSPSDTDK